MVKSKYYSSPKVPSCPRQVLRGHTGFVYVTRFSKSGEYCLSGSQDRSTILWSVGKGIIVLNIWGTQIKKYEAIQNYEVLDLAIANDNAYFITVGGDREIFQWDAKTGQAIRQLSGHLARINTISLSDDNSLILTGSHDASAKIWDLRSSNRQAIQTMKQQDSAMKVSICNFSLIVGSVDGTVNIYDIRKGLKHSDIYDGGIHNFAVSCDKRSYSVSTLHSKIYLCDLSNGEVLKAYTGHKITQFKIDLVYAWDDSWLLTGSEDGTIAVYDLLQANPIQLLKNHVRTVSALELSPNKDAMVSGSFDNTITLWTNRIDLTF